MGQLVILSGKGGTGKTNLSAAFAHLYNKNLDEIMPQPVLVDADVDAANLALLLEAEQSSGGPFIGSPVAEILQDHCTDCGRCEEVCRFEAVSCVNGKYSIDALACEGCAACLYQCPEEAIIINEQKAGEWYESETPYGIFFHAHLYPAQENSGKLVALIKRKAQDMMEKSNADLMLIDGPPGIGCPVTSSISGADVVLVVTEPSLAGLHDLVRIVDTAAHFDVKVVVCINKADLYEEGADQIRLFCQESGIDMMGEIPFDLAVPRAMAAGMPVTRYDLRAPSSQAISGIWKELLAIVESHSQIRNLIQLQ